MKLLQPINEFSLKLIIEATPIVMAKYVGVNGSISDAAKVRFLFLAQVIVSLIAIPLLLIAGLTAAILNICKDQDAESIEQMWGYIKLHLIFVIPTTEVGIVAPWATTVRIALAQAEWLGTSLIPTELQFTAI